MEVRHGITRTVFLVGKYAIKVPIIRVPWAWQHRVQGLMANLVERNTYHAWKKYPFDAGCELCPVLWCSWGGFVIVMRRADDYPHISVLNEHQCSLSSDIKPENYGMLNGNVVCLDYA